MVPKGSFYSSINGICYTQHVEDQRQLGQGTADSVVWKYAVRKNLNVLTADTDFKPSGSANPNNGSWPGVIFYDDSASQSRVLDALRTVGQTLNSNQISTLHENQQRPIYIPGKWA
jgi:predicted nuclease of predicted toxin-antitoxin system